MTKKLEIFKAGKHTPMRGQTIEFSAADLMASARAYDPVNHPAPLVVGHPKLDDPAYGWVQGLDFADPIMEATPGQVDPAFADLVNAGRYKRISASFFRPDAPNNPVPGVWYLRHVGFLGATAPAVKGLKPACFAGSDEGVVEFGSWTDRIELGLWRRIKNFLIGEKGQDAADQLIPEYELESLAHEAYQPEPDMAGGALSPAYADNTAQENIMTPQDLAVQKAALDQQATSFAEREKALTQREAAQRHADHVSFADGLVTAGKLLPAQKDLTVAMLDFAAEVPAGSVVEFGEGDGKQSQPMADALKAFLSAQPKIVDFGEAAGPEAEAQTVNFAAAPGYSVDAVGLALHNKALAYQAQHPGTGYMDAVKAVQ